VVRCGVQRGGAMTPERLTDIRSYVAVCRHDGLPSVTEEMLIDMLAELDAVRAEQFMEDSMPDYPVDPTPMRPLVPIRGHSVSRPVDSIWSDATARDIARIYGEASPTRLLDFIDGLLLVVAALPDADAHEAFARVGVHHSHIAKFREIA
jgi:hypothetical protein